MSSGRRTKPSSRIPFVFRSVFVRASGSWWQGAFRLWRSRFPVNPHLPVEAPPLGCPHKFASGIRRSGHPCSGVGASGVRGSSCKCVCAVWLAAWWLGGVGWCASGFLTPENLELLGCAAPDTRVQFVRASRPGNVFFPGESVDVVVEFPGGEGSARDLVIAVTEITARRSGFLDGRSGAGGLYVPRIENCGVRARAEWTVAQEGAAGSPQRVQLKGLPVPERLGTYALSVALEGEPPQFLGTVVRTVKPRAGFFIDAPILGEGLFLTHEDQGPEKIRERALALARLGIKGVRMDLAWNEPEPGRYDWRAYDELMKALEAAEMQALVTISGHPAWSMPFGAPTPGVTAENPDTSCEPAHYAAFGRFVFAFCSRYWREGQGALWGIEHWNEPWEGLSGSGWGSDARHYRELMRQIAENARRVDPRIRTAGACSIMNTELKFLTGDHPEENLQLLDVFTDHYVPPRSCYGPMVARYWGKESADTGTWIASNETLLVQVMVQFLACGQTRVTPWHPEMLYFNVPGAGERFQMPTPVASATAAFQRFVSGRPFERMLFLRHLPWAFQFGRGEDAVVVVCGRLIPLGGGDIRDLPWWQVELSSGGSVMVDNRDGALEFYDLAGNREWVDEAEATFAADAQAHYLRAPKGGAALIERRLQEARLTGVRPVAIVAHDFVYPLDAPGARLRVSVHNLLNRELAGTLTLKAPDSIELAGAAKKVVLGPGELRDVEFVVSRAAPSAANAYPFACHFQSEAGAADWSEVLHDLVVRRRTVEVDGRLDDWKGIPAVLAYPDVPGPASAESMWRPFLEGRAGGSSNRFAELRLAWDAHSLYVAAQVSDPTPSLGHLRLEQWDQDQYFHSAADDAVCEQLRPFESLILRLERDPADSNVLHHVDWPRFRQFLTTNAEALAAVETRAAAVYLRARKEGRTASFGRASHVYRRLPVEDRPYAGDTLQLGFDVLPGVAHHRMSSDLDRVVDGFHAMPDTDYEYAVYQCRNGRPEVWRYLAPAVPRSHPAPRQLWAKWDQGAVQEARCVILREETTLTYEVAIPWKELKEWKPQAGQRFGFLFRFNDSAGPTITFGAKKSATKSNSLSLHPYHEGKPSCSVEWVLGE